MKDSIQRLLFMVVLACLVQGCQSDSDKDNQADNSAAQPSEYNGPGSTWAVSLHTDTFTITRKDNPAAAVNLTINGDFIALDSGFLEMTVTEASGIDAPAPGEKAYGLEVPDYAFLLQPDDSGQLISMVAAGTCPTENIDANWIIVKMRDGASASDASQDFFGQFNFDVSTNHASIPSRYSLTGASLGGSDIGTGECNNGIMIVGESDDRAAMYLTDNGGAIVQTSLDDEAESSFIFGLEAKAMNNLANLEGNYSGWLFNSDDSESDKVTAVAMSCDAAGVCNGAILNLLTGAMSTDDEVTITLTGADSPQIGFIVGRIYDGSDTGDMVCMVDVDASSSGQKIVSCTGQSPGEVDKMFNVIFVSIET